MTPLDQAIYRLRSASGPGGRSAADVESVCDAAEKVDEIRRGVHSAIVYLKATGLDCVAATAIDMLEDALSGGRS